MNEILYLHGFGDLHPERCPVAQSLRRAVPAVTIHTPCYHPGQQIAATRIGDALESFAAIIKSTPSGRVHLVGYSFGGLLAAILASQRPAIVANILLLAPAIDNVGRNYKGRDPADWWMPAEFVAELKTYPARPQMIRPATLVHGTLDHDGAGAAVWRVQQWMDEQPFCRVVLLEGMDHSLQPWLSAAEASVSDGVPSFHQLITEMIKDQ